MKKIKQMLGFVNNDKEMMLQHDAKINELVDAVNWCVSMIDAFKMLHETPKQTQEPEIVIHGDLQRKQFERLEKRPERKEDSRCSLCKKIGQSNAYCRERHTPEKEPKCEHHTVGACPACDLKLYGTLLDTPKKPAKKELHPILDADIEKNDELAERLERNTPLIIPVDRKAIDNHWKAIADEAREWAVEKHQCWEREVEEHGIDVSFTDWLKG